MSKKLKANWTIEAMQDLMAGHGFLEIKPTFFGLWIQFLRTRNLIYCLDDKLLNSKKEYNIIEKLYE